MKNAIKKLKSLFTNKFFNYFPYTDAENYSITKFMSFASGKVKKSDRVLDAGAGACPYKRFFSHAEYESTDFEDIFDKSAKNKHNFICNLESIPKPEESYDVIVNTQVLEHVPSPQRVIDEFFSILKPGGRLFLTAPQGWGIHGEPYHFFNFTEYGLKSIFEKAGFKIIFIKPRGGIFWYLGKRLKILPSYIFSQYLFGVRGLDRIITFLLLPFYFVFLPICGFLIPLVFFFLDRLDRRQKFTLGYACYCKKNQYEAEQFWFIEE